MSNNTGVMSWDSPITEDAMEFKTLPVGTYDFKVKVMEQTTFTPRPGSTGKIQEESPMAKLQLEIIHEEETYIVFHDIILHDSTQGFLADFFTGIGQKKKGQSLVPRWQEVIGSTGTVTIKHEKYNGNNIAKVAKFINPEEAAEVNKPVTGW